MINIDVESKNGALDPENGQRKPENGTRMALSGGRVPSIRSTVSHFTGKPQPSVAQIY